MLEISLIRRQTYCTSCDAPCAETTEGPPNAYAFASPEKEFNRTLVFRLCVTCTEALRFNIAYALMEQDRAMVP